MCCFRTMVGIMEFHTNADCYEKLSAQSDVGCSDTPAFRDENQKRCLEWQGYDCDTAVTDWGYSVNGQSELLENCKSSCGKCTGNICHPACSVKVSKPENCPDCRGTWKNYDTCVNGNVVQKGDGRTQCVIGREYQVTYQPGPGGAPCPFDDAATSYGLTDIFAPSAWGACSAACGEGIQTRDALCLASADICSTFASDYQPILTQPCVGTCGAPAVTTTAEANDASIGVVDELLGAVLLLGILWLHDSTA